MALYVGGSVLSGGGGGVGEVLLNSFDFTTDTYDHGAANNTYRGFSTTDSGLFGSTYRGVRVVLNNVSTQSSRLGGTKFSFGCFIRKSGSVYPADHDLLSHGGLTTIGRNNNNGSGNTNYMPASSSFAMNGQFYRIGYMDFVFTYDGANKQPNAVGYFMAEMGGVTTSSAHYMSTGWFHYNGQKGAIMSGSWSGTADTLCFYNQTDSAGGHPYDQGTAKVYGIPV